jgi:hypothetical protein
VGAERTSTGEVVYLLAELRSERRGPVHEIGSQARVLGTEGELLTLSVDRGSDEHVVRCPERLVARRRNSAARRYRPSGPLLPPAA